MVAAVAKFPAAFFCVVVVVRGERFGGGLIVASVGAILTQLIMRGELRESFFNADGWED